MQDKIRHTAITFDDVLIEPRYSEVVPSEVETATRLTKRIGIKIPLISSPMDTVTESSMAIGLAKDGGPRRYPQEHGSRSPGRGSLQGETQCQRDYRRPRNAPTRGERGLRQRNHGPKQRLRGSHRACGRDASGNL